MVARFRSALAAIRAHQANGLQVAGLAFVVAGSAVLAVWLGLIVAGVCLGVLGWALDDVPAPTGGDE